ncbi:hypothetical protein BGI41_00005 [Methanobrevibacter sp. 87.7]|uniref:Ig-like domain repeat protein n=1 Tax=Methanobrevibacter sp. 87.7 TaxID=387957 RepID=UPI000B510875|nr:Ig-like domain repeat protein [Methanobrevibacter sp. 87.7]OWT33868.1 hypothetical protein BGI41_00005 [Methanobrevibacter sp. 87.7]
MILKNRRILFPIFLLILLIFSLSAVSAEDLNNSIDTNSSLDSTLNNNFTSSAYVLSDSNSSYYEYTSHDEKSEYKGISSEIQNLSEIDSEDYDIYFNASASVDGNGSKDNPYKYFSHEINGKKVFLADGTYNLGNTLTIRSNTTITGESNNVIINAYNRYGFSINELGTLYLNNLTLDKFSVTVYRNLIANNVIFSNSTYGTGSLDNTFGGFIYGAKAQYSYYNPNVSLKNCSFINAKASYGASIYLADGTLDIYDSVFMNSTSYIYGGAIAVYNTVVTISNTLFNNTVSLDDAGGAIYALSSTLKCNYNNFTNCNANFGGAISALSSKVNIDNCNFINNTVKYEGGAIFDIFSPITVSNSKFNTNKVMNGGALFVDNGTSFKVTSTEFNYNDAYGIGSAIFSNGNPSFIMVDTTFANNYDDDVSNNVYNQSFWPLYYGGSNATVIVNDNKKYNGTLPSKYNLVEHGYVTPVKNQLEGGSCWAFSALAALESSILKANNQTYDFSEENMKNLAVYYSEYGLMFVGGSTKLLPNEGGLTSMSVGYLVSWQGPINESLDIYDDYSYVSHLFNNETILHVQNVYYIPARSSYTDNDNIKRAILDYGAVGVSMYYSSSYLNRYSYYSNTQQNSNHAVTIVGWDDNYSKDNFYYTPAGNGAWIVKNSWGSSWGDNGYFYVSYYDTRFCQVGLQDAFCFILNDSTKYNRNYQYDTGGMSDWFVTGKNNIWYKNTFTSVSNDYLAAFSTYFESALTDYTGYVYLNDVLVDTVSGSTTSGYYTIKLNKLIPLAKGDKFTIAIKINTTNLANFPIEEASSYRITLYPNVSYFSYDGNNWIDLYDYSMNMSDYGHWYDGGQVACIKAFTTPRLNLNNATIVVENITGKTMGNTTIKAIVTDVNNGFFVEDGIVYFEINNKNHTAFVKDGIAQINYNFIKAGNYSIIGYYLGGSNYNPSNKSSTGFANITKMSTFVYIENKGKSKVDVDDYIYFTVKDENNNIVKNGTIRIKNGEDEKIYDLSKDSSYYIINSNKEANFTIYAFYDENDMYKSSTNSVSVSITKLNINYDIVVNGKNITIISLDECGNPINFSTTALISIYNNNGKLYNKTEFDLKDGNFSYLYDFEPGAYKITVVFNENDKYLASNVSSVTNVKSYTVLGFDFPNKIPVNTSSNLIVKLNDWNNNPVESDVVTILINVNGVNEDVRNINVNSGIASLQYVFTKSGNYIFTIIYNGNEYYDSNRSSVYVNILKAPSYINVNAENTVVRNDLLVNVSVFPSVATGSVSIDISGTKYYADVNDGYAIFKIPNLGIGNYTLSAEYSGDNNYESSKNSTKFIIYSEPKLTIDCLDNNLVAKLSDASGNPIVNAPITCIINNANKTYTTDENGMVVINNVNGKFRFTAIYNVGNFKVEESTNVLIKNPVRKTTNIIYSNFTQTAVDFYNGERGRYFNVVLKDSDGNLLANKPVSIGFNGVVYNLITDSNGLAKLQINLAWPGIYTFAVAFLGDDDYNGSFVVAKITINPKTTQLTVNDVKYKANALRKTITIKLTGVNATNTGKTVNAVGKTVKVSVNGKTYTVKTNSNGVASINVSINKKGTYTVVTSFAGDGTFSAKTTSSKLVIV